MAAGPVAVMAVTPGGLSSSEEEETGLRSVGELSVSEEEADPLPRRVSAMENRWSADGSEPVQPGKTISHLSVGGLSGSAGQGCQAGVVADTPTVVEAAGGTTGMLEFLVGIKELVQRF